MPLDVPSTASTTNPQADLPVSLPPAGPGGPPATSTGTSGFLAGLGLRVRRLFTRAPSPTSAPPALDTTDTGDAESPGGIHAITKTTNYWFDREVGVLERDARDHAADWAGKGLPRHDVTRPGGLEVEQHLAARSQETFRQWMDRVRVRVRDAIAHEAQTIGGHLAALRATTGRIERIGMEISDVDRRMADVRVETREDTVRVGVEPLLSSKAFFWIFAGLLALVEFTANFPVFRLLLPVRPALAQAANKAIQEVDTSSWWAGFAVQLREMTMHAEALVVALVAVLVLVLLGKTFGSASRVLMSLHASEYPRASTTIAGVRRQHWALWGACVVGLAVVLTFLFLSRGGIAQVAAERARADVAELDSLRRQPASNDLSTVSITTQRMLDKQRTLEIHRDDADYAAVVQRNNWPLFFLNLGLVMAAAVLGYLTHRYVVSDGKGEHPAIVELRASRRALQDQAHSAMLDGRHSETLARAGIGRVEHLMTASPLTQWRAKADRLNGVIPLFRGENSRVRGIDPASVQAFAKPFPLDLPTVEAEQGFPEPADFARLKQEFEEGRASLAAAVARIPITPLVLAMVSVVLVACGASAGAGPPAAAGRQFIVAIDLSASRPQQELDESHRLVDQLVDTQLRNGDQFVLIETYGGGAAGARNQWVDTVPASRRGGRVTPAGQQALDDFRVTAHSVVKALFSNAAARHIQQTDVLGTLARASDYAKAAGGRASTLLLLSDMENSTPELEMTRGIPDSSWIAARRAEERLPDMRGMCVVVSGARSTTARGAQIRRFWEQYFRAASGTLPASGYRDFIGSPAEVAC